MWRSVPADARVVLDLCTGSGVSLPGLRRPGRTVLGIDVSLAMLEVAWEEYGGPGWAPRLACADAFRLPLRDGALDAVTVAFGVRNLRPRVTALTEIARALKPGGMLVVLEATAPAPGPFAPAHRAWIRHVIPFAGRLSPDPTAYRYLSESIFEFGDGSAFERDLVAAGLQVAARRSFLLGATRLWVARRSGGVGQNRAASPAAVHDAMAAPPPGGGPAIAAAGSRTWLGVATATSVALTLALAWGLVLWINSNASLPLSPAQRLLGWGLLVTGVLVFGARSVWLGLQLGASARSR
jgi:demethylmenaquinone methyltransferase/2-methoxy-6-polyprenyl-1,4-benzoquinol methylase